MKFEYTRQITINLATPDANPNTVPPILTDCFDLSHITPHGGKTRGVGLGLDLPGDANGEILVTVWALAQSEKHKTPLDGIWYKVLDYSQFMMKNRDFITVDIGGGAMIYIQRLNVDDVTVGPINFNAVEV